MPDGRQLHRGVREAELRQPGARVDVEGLAHLHVGLVALARALCTTSRQVGSDERVRTRSTAPTTAVSHAGSALPGSRSRRNETAASWRRCAGATLSGSSIPRSAGSGRSVTRSTCGAHVRQQMEAVVALRVAVDHSRALQESLVLELLRQRRLARSERPDAEDRRVAVAVGALSQVERDRLPGPRQRVPEVEAPARSRGVRGGRHHRRDLLGRQRVVVASQPGPLTRQMLEEQLQLIAQRPMQAYLTVGAPAHLHALLQLLLAAGRNSDRERRAQQRRLARCLQVCEQVPRLLRALVAHVGDPLLPAGLRPHDLIGVLDPPSGDPQRQLVGQEARVQRQVHAERQALGRREHELGAGAREPHTLRKRAQHQLRLPARPELRLDLQSPAPILDVAVGPAHHVALQRRQHGLAVALEHERARLVQTVDDRFPQPPAERPAHEPLQLDAARLAHRQEVLEPRVRMVCAHAHPLELRRAQQTPVAHRQRAPEPLPPLVRMLSRRPRDVGGDVALGIAQAHQQEHRGLCRPDIAEAPHVLLDVALACAGVGASVGRRGRAVLAQPAGVALQLPAPANPQDLHVGLDRLQSPDQREEAGALAFLAQPRIGRCLHRKCRPPVVEPLGEHAVPVDEGDRRRHRFTRSRGRSIARAAVRPARARSPGRAPASALPPAA